MAKKKGNSAFDGSGRKKNSFPFSQMQNKGGNIYNKANTGAAKGVRKINKVCP